MGESDREIRAIEHYVRLYRARLGITPTPGFKIGEPSGLMEGEGRTLFVCQLVRTLEGDGGWKELGSPEVRQEVLGYISRLLRESYFHDSERYEEPIAA